jgi:hypothetical protein
VIDIGKLSWTCLMTTSVGCSLGDGDDGAILVAEASDTLARSSARSPSSSSPSPACAVRIRVDPDPLWSPTVSSWFAVTVLACPSVRTESLAAADRGAAFARSLRCCVLGAVAVTTVPVLMSLVDVVFVSCVSLLLCTASALAPAAAPAYELGACRACWGCTGKLVHGPLRVAVGTPAGTPLSCA